MKKAEKVLFGEMCQFKYHYKIQKDGKLETIREQVNGLLIITNCALRFKERSDAVRVNNNLESELLNDEYSLVYNRLKLNNKSIVVVPNNKDKTNNSWAIRVPTNDPKPKNLDFFADPFSSINIINTTLSLGFGEDHDKSTSNSSTILHFSLLMAVEEFEFLDISHSSDTRKKIALHT